MGDIAITSAVRSNLNALQSTADLMSTVQERLSTGKKVNSALDNPNSFFTAKALENRASDLSTLLDDQSQSVQTLKAADKGISAISDLVDAAKAKANQALQSSSDSDRKKFLGEYNELMSQIESVAKDSSYKGKNLLGGTGNDLKVIFNEDGSSKLDISAVDFTKSENANGLNLEDQNATVEAASFTIDLKQEADKFATDDTKLADLDQFEVGNTLTFDSDTTDGSNATVSLTIDENTTLKDLKDTFGNTVAYDASNGELKTGANQSIASDKSGFTTITDTATETLKTATKDAAFTAGSTLANDDDFAVGDTLTITGSTGSAQELKITADTKVSDLTDLLKQVGADSALSGSTLTITNSNGAAKISSSGTLGTKEDGKNHGFATDSQIEAVLGKLKTAQDTLRAQASTFGTNLSIVENRESFTKALINTLEEGAGKLTLADTNKEGANLLALQTQQQLASTSLSLASQASQNVLRLIG